MSDIDGESSYPLEKMRGRASKSKLHFLTPNRQTALEYHEQKAKEIRNSTKRITLVGGPFDGQVVRIKTRYSHFSTTIPRGVAESYPPFEFDGVEHLPETIKYVARYSSGSNERKFQFDEIEVFKQTFEGIGFPQGYERLNINE